MFLNTDEMSSDLITRLSDIGNDVRNYVSEIIKLRTLPLSERDGEEIIRIDNGKSEIEKECNLFLSEVMEYTNLMVAEMTKNLADLIEWKAYYKTTLDTLEIAPPAGRYLPDYPDQSIDSLLTTFADGVWGKCNDYKAEGIPKFISRMTAPVQQIRDEIIGSDSQMSIMTMLRRDEPASTFDTILDQFNNSNLEQISLVTDFIHSYEKVNLAVAKIRLALDTFKAEPAPLDI